MKEKRIIGINEKLSLTKLIPLSLQHTFAMFGASVLVPIIFGINPSIVLLMNGVGTILFILITKGKSPAYLGSSFAFIAPAILIISNPNYGYKYALGGFVVVGLFGIIFSFIIKKTGTNFIDIILPPAAMGAVVSLIGFELAFITIKPGKVGADLSTKEGIIVFSITLCTAILGSILFRKFFATIPILIAMIIGYLSSIYFGMVDLSLITNAKLFTFPTFMFANLRLLVEKKVDYNKSSNLILTSIIFITALSGLSIKIFGIELKGMVLSSLVGIILSLLFYIFDKLNILNERL